MANSKKVTVGADGSVTAEDASFLDVATTLISTDSAVTGTYGLVQRLALLIGGMAINAKRLAGSWNPIASR